MGTELGFYCPIKEVEYICFVAMLLGAIVLVQRLLLVEPETRTYSYIHLRLKQLAGGGIVF